MPQPKKSYEEVRIPFERMSFTPDIPATSLGPNEYNAGANVETDIRGIKSVLGDQEILGSVPGTPTFVSSGFRQDGLFWFIVATNQGQWWAAHDLTWYDITPVSGPIVGYSQSVNITEAWNGTIPFFNDTIGPPMFWPEALIPGPVPEPITVYSNVQPTGINTISIVSAAVQRIVLDQASASPLYSAGEQIVITDVNLYFNGTYTVVSSTTTTIDFLATVEAVYPGLSVGTVSPLYCWNYNPDWTSVTAQWLRIYNSPNVGSILIAGNLTAVNLDSTVSVYPVTVQWTGNFGLNQAPTTWQPTVLNVANQLEVPLRGASLDAWPLNGQLFLSSYWDTVVLSPLNYTTTSAPILGIKMFAQGRGLLTANCWVLADDRVYGVDARDIWVFDGNSFRGLGNQRVKNWFYKQLHPLHHDRLYVEVNSAKNQIEIYYPDLDAEDGVPNKMLSYRFDIDIFNAPRDVDSASFTTESPIYNDNVPNVGSKTVVYARGVLDSKLVQKDKGFSFINSAEISSSLTRDNIKLLPDYSGRIMIHRVLPEVVSISADGLPVSISASTVTTDGVTVTIAGANSVGQLPTVKNGYKVIVNVDDPWLQVNQNAYRVNSLILSNSSNNSAWLCSATTWQFTQVESDS